MQILVLEHFAGVVGESFSLAVGDATMALNLVEARPLPVNPFPGMMRAPFSLMFRTAQQVILPQRLYRLENATMGALDVFLVPVGRDGQGVLYQAVFN